MNEEERIMRVQQFNACTDTYILLSTIVVGDIRTEKLITDIVLIVEPSNDEALEYEALQTVDTEEPETQLEIIKFICKDTIEEKIIELGEKKRDNPEYKPGVTPEEKILECLEDLCYLIKEDQA